MKEGWQIKKLGDLSRNKDAIVSGPFGSNLKVSDYKDAGVPIFRLQNVGKGKFINKDIKYISEKKAEQLKYHSFKAGDLVLAKLGIPIGKTCIVPDEFLSGIIVADVVRLRPDNIIVDYKFLEYFLNSDGAVSQLTGNITGATRPRVNLSDVRNIEINLPPLPEQQRIVSILDRAFTAIDKAKANAEQNLQNAKELFESYLQGVFENGDWETRTIQEITRVINGYAFKSKDFKPTNSIKSVKITNVGVKEFVEETDNYLPEEFGRTLNKVQVKEGDIVIALTRTIISAGLKVAVVPATYDGALVNQRVAALVANEEDVNPSYLYYYLTTKGVADYVLAHVNTLMQPNLSINDLKTLPVPLPSTDEQESMVRHLDAMQCKTQELEAVYQQKLDDLEELKKSILQKAFAGELRGDEPAESETEKAVAV